MEILPCGGFRGGKKEGKMPDDNFKGERAEKGEEGDRKKAAGLRTSKRQRRFIVALAVSYVHFPKNISCAKPFSKGLAVRRRGHFKVSDNKMVVRRGC